MSEVRRTRLEDRELIEPSSRAQWRAWLEREHNLSDGVWLAIGKKDAQSTALRYDDVVEEALCFGWIDSTVRRLDDERFKQLLTPRRAGGTWSALNKARVERLKTAGLMTAAGRAAIAAAKADGSWDTLTDAEAGVISADLAEALAANPAATSGFDAYPHAAKAQALYWIASAKREQTRAARIAETIAAAADGRRVRE